MARQGSTEEVQPELAAETPVAENAAPTEAAAPKTDNRSIMINDPSSGQPIKRVDWIRRVFQDPNSGYYGDRGAIAKKLTELQGKPVPYQIVFAATKDLKHIKKPEAAAPAPAGEAPAEA